MMIDNDVPMEGPAPAELKRVTPRTLCIGGPLNARFVITDDKHVLCDGGTYELEKSAIVPGEVVFVWQEKAHAVELV